MDHTRILGEAEVEAMEETGEEVEAVGEVVTALVSRRFCFHVINASFSFLAMMICFTAPV